jgi:antitoxin VapB
MAIHIKNVETERKARELATLTGGTLTGVIDQALERRLVEERGRRKKPTLEEMIAATEEFRRKAGLDKEKLNITKADFDALYDFIDEEIAKGRN